MVTDLIKNLKLKYQDNKVLVVGLGLQGGGEGVARFMAELGAKVTVTDKKSPEILQPSVDRLKNLNIAFHLGYHDVKDFVMADIIFKGPSVLWTMPEIVEAQKKQIPIEMEMAFVVANTPAKVIGITGTRGKSTTTNLIFNILKDAGLSVYLGGGLPDISNINFLKTLTKDDWLVAELSSWALSGFHQKKISPHIAVLTNIYPDHLNYYQGLDDYSYDKQAIYLYQKPDDFLVVNESLKEMIIDTRYDGNDQNRGDEQLIFFNKQDFPDQLVYLKGDHNLENAGAALKVANLLKIDQNKVINTIKNFRGVAFRQQIIGKKKQITFVNDTTSTTPIATIKAINSFSDKLIFLILGGNAKNLPYKDMLKELKKVNKIILLDGSFTQEILPALKKDYSDKITDSYTDIEKAVNYAYELASQQPNECYILFSPGATSFAMFNNEFHRGREFNRVVNQLITG